MTLSKKSESYIIPEYSLTGDLLSYQRCGLQYRYQNRGSLPPSSPVQLWFGEFIHGVMEDAYKIWKSSPDEHSFPWDWKSKIHPIEIDVNRRLSAQGLRGPPNIFCSHDESEEKPWKCPDSNHPHKLLASKRSEATINIWGKYLFPLIECAEIKLVGTRPMPDYQKGKSRSNYYGIKGIADVISLVKISKENQNNEILNLLNQNPQINGIIDELSLDEYEVIIDYKGMRRPSVHTTTGEENEEWNLHEWQILTYAWLRERQPEAKKPIAGIIFYLNELEPTSDNIDDLAVEVREKRTDKLPSTEYDRDVLDNFGKRGKNRILSESYKKERSIRIIPISEEMIQKSLEVFDTIVGSIESSVISERDNGKIIGCWKPNPDEKTCTACDHKYHCPAVRDQYNIKIP